MLEKARTINKKLNIFLIFDSQLKLLVSNYII